VDRHDGRILRRLAKELVVERLLALPVDTLNLHRVGHSGFDHTLFKCRHSLLDLADADIEVGKTVVGIAGERDQVYTARKKKYPAINTKYSRGVLNLQRALPRTWTGR